MKMSTSSCSLEDFNREKHIGYFAHCLRKLPDAYSKLDTNRLTLAHFAVHALDLLGVWEDDDLQGKLGLHPKAIIEWMYSLQVVTDENNDGGPEDHWRHVGFKGGSFLGRHDNDTALLGTSQQPRNCTPFQYNHGHVAMTYTALCTLRTLGDDWSRVDRLGIIRALRGLQLDDGSFQCIAVGSEHDMRFLYCACCISHLFDDWSGVDIDKAARYIRSCRSFDGGIALLPGQEGHGGSTFCATASLVLMGRLDEVIDAEWRKDLIRWCTHRQVGGMQGRPNKAEDTCYSYWIGGTLRLLGEDSLLEHDALRSFVMQCQSGMGGFSKIIGAYPDLLHSFYSMAYLSLSQRYLAESNERQYLNLKELNCTLGICMERASLFEPVYP